MRAHEHVLISAAYAGGVALLVGQGLTDPFVYLAAILGGGILDLVDRPLYHLVYGRNEPHVAEARQIFSEEGLKSAIAYIKKKEAAREFKGLLLHNVFALLLTALIGIFFSFFLPASVYWMIFWGAMLLHMLTDIYSDFAILGHVDNWLWVIPENWLEQWGQRGNKLVNGILLWVFLILLGFLLVTLRWGWQLAHPSAYTGLYDEGARSGRLWLPYIPLLGLVFYLSWIAIMCIAAVHKYNLELGHKTRFTRVPFSIGSVKLLRHFISGQIPRSRENLERVILRIQADQAIWVVIVAMLIVIVMLGITWLGIDNDLVVFLVPAFLSLLFGTFIHTTVGEFGGAYGVAIAWLLNLALAHLGLQALWPVSRGYILFGAAAIAWILGLVGTMFVKGNIRMSLVAFTIQVRPKNDTYNDDWIRVVLDLAEKGLQTGYNKICKKLYGDPEERNFLHISPANLLLTPYMGRPIMCADYYHLQATDSYVPVLREMAYILCDNQLMSKSQKVGQHGLLPVMGRYRVLATDTVNADIDWLDDAYYWHSLRRPLVLRSPSLTISVPSVGLRPALIKTWAEVVDHFLTRKSSFQTDLFIYGAAKESDPVVICGLTRERTSTKEYATVEAEAYAGAVMDTIIKSISNSSDVCLAHRSSVRLFYPQVSFFDQALVKTIRKLAVLPSESGVMSQSNIALIQQSLSNLPDKNLLTHATADFGEKLRTLIVETAAAALIATIGFNSDLITQFISKMLGQP